MDFQKKVSHYLGKNAARRWKDIISDITAVIGGIKPSFLYDYSSCNSKSLPLDELAAEMESICICLTDRPAMHMERAEHSSSVNIDNFRVEKRESGETRTTGVVSIQDDVFVINRQILRNMLEKFVSKHNEIIDGNAIARSEQLHDKRVCAFIDVSGKLPNPSWADRKVDEQMVVIANDILRQIRAGSVSGVRLNLTIQDDWNISTIFGLLLGYPVSYWYQLDNHDNCLAHTPLHVIKCKCDCVLRSAGADDSMNVSRSSIMFGNKSHVIYSFSIPASLLENASDHVSRWKQYVCHAVDMCEYFNSVSFESSTVTLSAVAL